MDIIEKQKREAKSIKELLATPGWEVLNTHLQKRAKELTTDLIEELDPKRVVMLQAEIKSINALISKIVELASVKTD